MLPLLLDERTRPPVALLCQASEQAKTAPRAPARPFSRSATTARNGWRCTRAGRSARSWPLSTCPGRRAAIAIANAGGRRGAQPDGRALPGPQQLPERAGARAGCRDQDELWDHLFESRSRAALLDWRSLFGDVFSYCAMARLDYEPAVLEAEGSLPRERHMAAHIARWRGQVDGPIVVVTGGFHTSALIDLLDQVKPIAATARRPAPSWLIRYSFERLDALNGYGAGMPAPAYYQAVWEALQTPGPGGEHHLAVAVDQLTQLAQHSRARGLQERISTARSAGGRAAGGAPGGLARPCGTGPAGPARRHALVLRQRRHRRRHAGLVDGCAAPDDGQPPGRRAAVGRLAAAGAKTRARRRAATACASTTAKSAWRGWTCTARSATAAAASISS